MCGITGYLAPGHSSLDQVATIQGMTDTLSHRGPDDDGVWSDPEAGCALGHRRLSIIELSPLGAQPMSSICGRYVIVYNGEVYNFKLLRIELEAKGHRFRGGSDTEVILTAISQWGLKEALSRFIGMFAFALWDRQERVLSLARDRIGIKPLYYGWVGNSFVFGSEIKALRAFPGFGNSVDRDALCIYFRHGYLPAPYSVYKKVQKLESGHTLTIGPGTDNQISEPYWSIRDIWMEGAANQFRGSEQEAEDHLESLLLDAVGLRMISDVPLGAFLSGGMDSSMVVALMQAQSSKPIKTYSIGFHEKRFNEAEQAKAVAKHLGTDHTELYLAPKDLLDMVTEVPKFWDEPFADSSQIPTYCVSRLAREGVSVSLSGDGGDELFNGYSRHHFIDRVWQKARMVPRPVRKGVAAVAKCVPESFYALMGHMGPKIRWRLDALGCRDFQDFYSYLFAHNRHPERLLPGAEEPMTLFTKPEDYQHLDHYQMMSLIDLSIYLPDDILTKVDRASMALGLEARVPLLDHRVVEFAATLPTSMKVKGGKGKRILHNLLCKYVPQELVDRPKMGFGVPVDQWLAGELRDWCEDLLDYSTIKSQGYLNADEVSFMWKEYLSGKTNWCHLLWDVLMFQAWLRETNG
ncbi:MAG: asparagine synthase (glutamine-hydrolyzing) [Pseudodesulfovibrio sp.]